MRVGIYNRFLGTLGGGERYMGKIAQILSQVADVEIISQAAVTSGVIRDRLGIDLSDDVKIVGLEDPSIETAEKASAKYDLFINASHLDPVCSRAARSILLVYFPSPTTLGLRGRARRALGEHVIRPLFSIPLLSSGFEQQEFSGGTRFWWTDGDGRLEIAAPRGRQPRLLVPLASFRHDGSGPRVEFVSGPDTVGFAEVPPGSDFSLFPVTPTTRVGGSFELRIQSDSFTPPSSVNDPRRLGVAVGEIRPAGLRGAILQLAFQRLRPELRQSLYGRRPEKPPRYVRSYSSVWTISRFVREWTRRYWGVDSALVYPPVDVAGIQSFGQVPKENLILNVGRFFEGHHNKKHLEMIEAFRRMLKQGLSGWQLVLVGGVSDDPTHLEYLERVRAAASGLPVRIALDIPYDELVELYARSSVYWHATGYDVDERREPGAMEHFGITTVEAMAAGCVPVVIGKAGQREIVRHRRDGLLWRDLEELCTQTWAVVRSPELRSRLSEGARQRSRTFSDSQFERSMMELFDAAFDKAAIRTGR
jgi:glycosyltransferase involved in cell wall biosynthesis